MTWLVWVVSEMVPNEVGLIHYHRIILSHPTLIHAVTPLKSFAQSCSTQSLRCLSRMGLVHLRPARTMCEQFEACACTLQKILRTICGTTNAHISHDLHTDHMLEHCERRRQALCPPRNAMQHQVPHDQTFDMALIPRSPGHPAEVVQPIRWGQPGLP